LIVYKDSSDPTALSFKMSISMDKTGYDGLELDHVDAVYSYLESMLSGNLASKVVTTLGTMRLGQHSLLLLTRMTLLEMQRDGVIQTSKFNQMQLSANDRFAHSPTDVTVVSAPEDSMTFELNGELVQMFQVEALLGYVMLGCLLIYGVFVIRKRYFVSPSQENDVVEPSQHDEDAENNMANSSHNMLSKKQRS